ncbi:MAG: type II toxin-antitoxin system RelE/ParE family toxin [Gammaproteobacteria bacterium]|nr:type II toxin-antitoxin system RelE/ParE family toxin [Gammaproteobacteria bacterium]MBQ0841140.1 type II toxin-antitoxin system RelE/ParE family toxin [Gammaproteobacteria bacterium]
MAPAAKNNLRNIYQYGLRQWGQAQPDSYLTAIKDQFWSLTEQPLMGVERSALPPNTRSLAIQSHILFYRVTAGQLEIIRILHSRQDPQRHLK